VTNVPPPPPPPGFGEHQPPAYGPPGQPGYGAPGYGAPGYGAPGYGAPGYGAPGYGGYPTNQREHPAGGTVLALGIIGLVVGFTCGIGFLISPIAWAKGHSARKQMDAEPGVVWTNRGNVTAGWICGIIGSVLLGLALAFILLAIVLVAAGA
jgi:hypothetical protein